MAVYGVFFDQALFFEDTVDGSVGGQCDTQLLTLPFDRRDAHLGIRICFELKASVLDEVLSLYGSLMRTAMGSLGVIPIPFGMARLVTLKPLQKPFLRSSQFPTNRNGRSLLQVLLNGHPSQAFFFHRFPSCVIWDRSIIPQTIFQGNRCSGTKIDIKGNLCCGTSG